MKQLLTIILLLTSVSGFTSIKTVDNYAEIVKNEEAARLAEFKKQEIESVDTYDSDREAEEQKREEDEVFADEEVGPDMTEYVETTDDAGYDKNNMDRIREEGHRAWDKLQKGFDQPNK